MSQTYLVLGYARSGKDTFAEIFASLRGLTFYSSSFFVNEKVVFPVLSPKYGYKTFIECYEDRVNHRVEWRDLILEYNTPDKTRMARELLEVAQIYVGMRSNEEYQACEKAGLFDEVYWISASPRVPEDDPSLDIIFDPSRMILVDNSGTKRDLFWRAQALARY